MKFPVRVVESRYGDRVTFNFPLLQIVRDVNGEREVIDVSSRHEMWRRLRETRDTCLRCLKRLEVK